MVERTIVEIEEKYYGIIERYYSELYDEYLKCDKNTEKAIKNYCSMQPKIYIPGNKNLLNYKRKTFIEDINAFWNEYLKTVTDYILSIPSVGIFGVGDSYSWEFNNEIRRNALFYDVIVLNDPFRVIRNTREFELKQNEQIFFRNILHVMDIKRFVVSSDDRQFVILAPLDDIITEEEKEHLLKEAELEGKKYVNEIFGLGDGELWEDILLMKNLSLEEAQEKLYEYGMFLNLGEAMTYSQDMLSEKDKREFEKFCFESWGDFNRDFLRCVLMLEAIPSIAINLFYIYKQHGLMSAHLKSNPILGRNEWMPVKRDALNKSFRAPDDYLFCCSVHRNDRMQELVSLNPDEILEIRSKDEPKNFRRFFHKVTEDMYFTYDDLDGISNEVYKKFDELLDNEVVNIRKSKIKRTISAVIGMLKGALGFVPLLSYVLSAYDIGVSAIDLSNNIKQKETIIEHIGKRK